jgi:hypothetical protein
MTDTLTGWKMAKTDVLAIASPGSRARKNAKYERYCRLRALAQPRIPAYREVGWHSKRDDDAYGLWAIHEANIQDFFTTEDQINPTETTNNPAEIANNPDQQKVAVSRRVRVVPRPLADLDPETAKLIEDVTVDSRGRLIPRLYSKMQASKELRSMLNLNAKSDAADVTKLSDQELLQTLAQQARELGIEIDLSYSFAQPPKREE